MTEAGASQGQLPDTRSSSGSRRVGETKRVDLAIDETSFQKRLEYVTVVTDRNSGTIIEVLDD